MEKPAVLKNDKLESISKKAIIADRLQSFWGEKPSHERNSKYETKKLEIKLETSGKEKRKLFLKLESGSSKINSNNFLLLSELLKEFFNVNGKQQDH